MVIPWDGMGWDRHNLLWDGMGWDRKICPMDKPGKLSKREFHLVMHGVTRFRLQILKMISADLGRLHLFQIAVAFSNDDIKIFCAMLGKRFS